MRRGTSRGVQWGRTASGVLVPVAHFHNITDASRASFAAIGEKAADVARMFERAAVSIPPSSGLGRVLAEARRFPTALLGTLRRCELEALSIRACWINRIVDAILTIDGAPSAKRVFRELVDGNLDRADVRRSKAQDTLWEVEMFALLREAGLQPTFTDPPDIAVELCGANIGIACKNLYSAANTRKALSRAVMQVEAAFDLGIAAISTANLASTETLRAQTLDLAGELARREVEAFCAAHERHFAAYLPRGRIGAAIVATMRIADVETGAPRFNSVQEIWIWNDTSLAGEQLRLLGEIRRRIEERGP